MRALGPGSTAPTAVSVILRGQGHLLVKCRRLWGEETVGKEQKQSDVPVKLCLEGV